VGFRGISSSSDSFFTQSIKFFPDIRFFISAVYKILVKNPQKKVYFEFVRKEKGSIFAAALGGNGDKESWVASS
jgi:hypothetical protein